ncbi:MAG: S49 family peptidase [Litoreibacter sp.]|nr:S49 family peptidase [Litoreibacter sp.]
MKRFIPFMKSDPLVAVVKLNGVIAAGGRGQVLSDASTAPLLEKAFRKGKPKAVALVINSPGGSPVQSSLIGARIKRLSQELEVKTFAFVEDVAASGGYWLAASADEIWVDESSITGSIGVISASFGFNELLDRYGIERRVHTAGKDKSMLDPFRPERPEDVERLKALQKKIHDNFIAHVKAGRGDSLSDDKDLFTGEIWVGNDAQKVGLVDGIGHVVPKMKELYGDKVRFQVYGQKRPFFARFGAQMMGEAIGQMDDRALWARYGL